MALAQELRRRAHIVDLMTDERVASYGQDFPARRTHVVPSATPSIRNPLKLIGAGSVIAWGTVVAWRQFLSIDADAVIAFGGYPTVPAFLGAKLHGRPGMVHDANAVLGRANHALAHVADVLALGFEKTARIEGFERKVVVTGNPVRDGVRQVADVPYPELDESDSIRLLVFGGSQGARAFAELMPPALALLPAGLRARLSVVQQARAADLESVTAAYAVAGISAELATFFSDLPRRMAESHLVISRSGASTIAELCVIGRPAILVPLPGAIDADQKYNARVVEAAGGGWIAEQASLTPDGLANRLRDLLAAPGALRQAAAAAKALGRPNAVALLADLAEKLASGKKSEIWRRNP
jgi:UDP-N-acetylglucosamine--N-acetylmuramyl-(pentapeptide) pyrophosphoryl-undecaprenol N-acetylglucosamine transferase